MNTRRWSAFILLVALGAGVVAFALRLDPCLASLPIALGGIAGLSIVVMRNARRKLAVSRAELMRQAQMCPACGYTIRVQTPRCPECGTPTARA